MLELLGEIHVRDDANPQGAYGRGAVPQGEIYARESRRTMNKLVTSRTVQRHLIRAYMRQYRLSWMKAARQVLAFTVASRWIAA